MLKVSRQDVMSLAISPVQCVQWVRESFCLKYEANLPAKISIHPNEKDFFNTMPCLLPREYDRFGVKVVSRIVGRKPSLHSDLLLYQASTGELLSVMDADWITQMRTGAVAALAIQTLQNKDAKSYGFVGLGSTAYATMECLLPYVEGKGVTIKLYNYKDQADQFSDHFSKRDVSFDVVDTPESLVSDTDVIVSAVTEMSQLFCPNEALYKKGVLVVPVHTKGFQNCDLFFDHVFADDQGHVNNFKYFNQFRKFNELSEVLLGRISARESNEERILSYNIGIGLHDVYFANKIYEKLLSKM